MPLEGRRGQDRPLIDYPTAYTFKVMGRQEHGFREYVQRLFRDLTGTEVAPDSLRELPSSGGKYVSVSVSVHLLSEEQRRSIYLALHRDKRILYYL